jgi:hypothetical protein
MPSQLQVEVKYNLRMMIPPNHYKHKSGSLSNAVVNCEAKEGTIEYAMKTAETGNMISTMQTGSIHVTSSS